MVERAFAFAKFDRDRIKFGKLFVRQKFADLVHVVRETFARQKVPFMTSRNVVQTAVFTSRIVKSDPARQMRHRRRPCPVRMVLMPDDNAAVFRGLYEKLVVPKTHGRCEQLKR